MKKNKLSKIFSTLALTVALVLNFSLVANALNCTQWTAESDCKSVLGCKWNGTTCIEADGFADAVANTKDLAGEAGLSTETSVPQMVGNTIRIVLGLSGTAALIFVVIGGIKWMTSAGDTTKIGNARKLMISGAVGVLIIAAAYAITDFVMKQMVSVVA